jgi:hypothetical protein
MTKQEAARMNALLNTPDPKTLTLPDLYELRDLLRKAWHVIDDRDVIDNCNMVGAVVDMRIMELEEVQA